MAITIASRKAKGRKLQQWVCQKISELLNIPYGEDEEISSRPMGCAGTDVSLSTRVKKLFPFAVECKSCESWSIHKDMEQAKNNMWYDSNWLLCYKKNGSKPVVVLDAEVFFNILKEKNNE